MSPDEADQDQFLGEIRLFGGTNIPSGWEFCNGQLTSIGENSALFSLIGTTYGGDGVSTFGLPDLRGRVPIHVTNGYPLGQPGGLEGVVLQAANLPAHSHAVTASTLGGSDSPKGAVWGLSTVNVYANPGSANLAMSTDGITPAGAGKAHDNMVPFFVVGYIIALAGNYPSKPEGE
jgi:microcystin-dependent protein